MSDEVAIRVEGLSKVYRLYDKPVDRLKESLHPLRKKFHREFYALNDVSFSVKKGETVGIIGQNGSGKSTLLKIITGVLSPSAGQVHVAGRISALLELGTGFNPELTGVENVFFNGMVMGYSREEMDARLDSILAFADIGDFVHQPVKTYSSGMFVRLAFAVATAVEPEILIVDEALAVGDIRFTQKCYRLIRKLQEGGTTVLFVSHDTGAVSNFCQRSLWLNDGKLFRLGESSEIIDEYVSFMHQGLLTETRQDCPEAKPSEDLGLQAIAGCESFGDGGAVITHIGLFDNATGKPVSVINKKKRLRLRVRVLAKSAIADPIYGFTVTDARGEKIYSYNTFVKKLRPKPLTGGEIVDLAYEFDFPPFCNGTYMISPAIAEGTQQAHRILHWVYDAIGLRVESRDEAYSGLGSLLVCDDETRIEFE